MGGNLCLQRCPCCRARFKGDEAPELPCRRCGADLSSLREVYLKAAHLQGRARAELGAGRFPEAYQAAWEAAALVDEPATRRTLAAALAGLGRQEEARVLLQGA